MGEAGRVTRVSALDGLRGWAALAVVCYHFTWELFGARFPEFRSPVTAIAFNGTLAVYVFFCISGYVLTIGSWRASKSYVARQLLKRHSRLAIPILASTLIVYFLMVFGLPAHLETMRVMGREDWLGAFLDFEPNLSTVGLYSVWTVFVELRGPGTYNAFLWTMPFELWGSLLMLLASLCERPRWLPYVLLGVPAVVLTGVFGPAACFPIGALLALAQRDGLLRPSKNWQALFGLLLAVTVAGLIPVSHLMFSAFAPICGVIVFLVLTSPAVSGFLTNRLSQALGRLSFPLYLMQWPVLITLSSHLVLSQHAAGTLDAWSALFIALVSVAASLVAAWMFMPVERFTAWFGRGLVRLVFRRPVVAAKAPA